MIISSRKCLAFVQLLPSVITQGFFVVTSKEIVTRNRENARPVQVPLILFDKINMSTIPTKLATVAHEYLRFLSTITPSLLDISRMYLIALLMFVNVRHTSCNVLAIMSATERLFRLRLQKEGLILTYATSQLVALQLCAAVCC